MAEVKKGGYPEAMFGDGKWSFFFKIFGEDEKSLIITDFIDDKLFNNSQFPFIVSP